LLPDIDGIELLRRMKAVDPNPEVIVISGQGTIKRALEAGQAGAFFFIEKTDLDPAGITTILDRALSLHDERQQHDGGPPCLKQLFGASAVAGSADFVARRRGCLLDDHLQPIGHHRLVIDNEHPLPLAASCVLGIHAFASTTSAYITKVLNVGSVENPGQMGLRPWITRISNTAIAMMSRM
jgi:hypothetical protein